MPTPSDHPDPLRTMRGRVIGRALVQTVLAFAWQQHCYPALKLLGFPP